MSDERNEALKDAGHLYEAEHRAHHLDRPGFRISEIRLSTSQQVPWHMHNHISDTFYVIAGQMRLFVRDPKEEIRLCPGDSYKVAAGRPHLVTNGGEESLSFVIMQGVGEYDYVPLV